MYDKLLSASIDLRFDQTDSTSDGLLVCSFENVKRAVDAAKAAGFTAIDIDTNVPINVNTGELQLFLSADPSGNRQLPKDIWKIIDYAKSLGLGASINLNIVNAINDNPITTSSVGKNFSTTSFFNAVKQYEVQIAELAEAHKVDAIEIGDFNFGFDEQPYEANWIEIIASIRSVYKGILGYECNVQSRNIIWDHVDALCLYVNPVLSQTPLYDPNQIIWKYFQTEDFPQYGGPQNSFQQIQNQISSHPNKKYYIWDERFSPSMEAVGPAKDLWGPLMEAQASGSDPDFSSLKFDNELMLAWYQSFFEFFGNYLSQDISGVSIWSYAPWADSDWLRNPNPHHKVGVAWNIFAKAQFLNYQPLAEKQILEYAMKPWGWHTINYDLNTKTDINNKAEGIVQLKRDPLSGNKLTVSQNISDKDGLGVFNYQWYLNGSPISELTADSYTISNADSGNKISVEVWYTDGEGTGESIFSSSLMVPINGTAKSDKLTGTSDNDVINGLEGNDSITGLAGNDTIDGGIGNDMMVGGLGDDTYYLDSIEDKITEKANQGADTVISAVTYTLGNHLESLTLSGSSNINATGNTLKNVITGNSKNNSINGGLGNDILTGGAGNDRFVFNTKLGTANIDTITDFTTGDKIALAKSILKAFSKAGTLTETAFYTAAGISTSNAVTDRILYDQTSGKLYYDADGSGTKSSAIQIALIGTDTHAILSASDFVIV